MNIFDHAGAIEEIIGCGIDTYTSQGTKEALRVNGHRVKTIKAKEQFRIGTWTILPFETQHDAKEPLGFLLQSDNGEKLLFATDTYYVRYKFSGLNYIMVECNYAADILKENVESGKINPYLEKRLLKSHFSLENVKEFLKANDLSDVKEIYLLHLSESNGDPDRFKKEIQELTGKPVYIAG